jgi:hypothetical protein
VAWRLLLVGLALRLRQGWGWLTGPLARDRQARPQQWLEELSLGRLRDGLADALRTRSQEHKAIDFRQPLETLSRCAF